MPTPTAAQIQVILNNLVASITTLSAEIAESVSAADRAVKYRDLETLQKSLAYWNAQLASLQAGGRRPVVVQFGEPA